MTVYQHQILAGALSGFAGALVVDLETYSQSADDHPFNWKKAIARWIRGAVMGAMTAAGISAITA